MSRSLIRKNQLHPDIADLVGQYGSGFFVSDGQVVYISGNQTISGKKTFATGIVSPLRIGNPGDIDYGKVQLWETASESYQTISSVDGGFAFSQSETNVMTIEFYNEYITLSHQAGGYYRFLSGYGGTVPIDANVVHVSGGNETISGVKTFASRPTVNGTGVLLSGEAVAVAQLPNTIVYTTGNQTIGGYKSFTGLANILQVGGYSFLNGAYLGNTSLRAQNIHVGATSSTTINHILGLSTMPGNFQSSEVFANPVSTILNQNNVAFTTGNQTISGVKTFTNLTVGGTGVLLSGSTPFVINFGHARNNTTAGSQYYYFGPPLDIGPAALTNNDKRRVQIMQDCFLRRVVWTSLARDNVPTPSNAITGYFKNFGNNPLADDQTAGVQVTSAINIPAVNTMYNNSTGNLNILVRSGEFVSFYYQTNFNAGSNNLASGLTVGVNAYFYV